MQLPLKLSRQLPALCSPALRNDDNSDLVDVQLRVMTNHGPIWAAGDLVHYPVRMLTAIFG